MAYKEWLERIISEYQPDWICDKLTEIGDYCEKNCRSDWNSNCLRRYYEAVVQKERNDMAIIMKLDDEIDKTKWLKYEEKIELKKQNKGKTICPIMSSQIIQWNGGYAVCLKELCALWNDDHCAFCKKAESEEKQ